MLLRIANSPRHYAWGSRTGIAEVMGSTPSGLPEAELWFGTHHASPTTLVEHDAGYATLAEYVTAYPEVIGGTGTGIPFLLKVLAAGEPLSLQVHPSPEQARAGFARENEAGIPLTAANRNYKDDQAKPELIVAVSDEFVGLSGFRSLDASVDALRALLAHTSDAATANRFLDDLVARSVAGSSGALRWACEFMLGGSPEVSEIVSQFTQAARALSIEAVAVAVPAQLADVRATIVDLAEVYPGDPGVVLGALLNRVTLARGEALYLPAGNVHAYLRGTGIELMNASDNVLRGGLTTKHIDIAELLDVADFSELAEPRLPISDLAPGVRAYEPESSALRLYVVDLSGTDTDEATLVLDQPAIALCVDGDVQVGGVHARTTLVKGGAVFVSADESPLVVRGRGKTFVATVTANSK